MFSNKMFHFSYETLNVPSEKITFLWDFCHLFSLLFYEWNKYFWFFWYFWRGGGSFLSVGVGISIVCGGQVQKHRMGDAPHYEWENPDSVIYKLIHYNAKYKFLETSLRAQNTLFDVMNKTAVFWISHLIQQWSVWVDKKLKGVLNYYSEIKALT